MPEILIESEAAAYMRVAVGTLRNWRSGGRGPRYSKAGGRVIYRRSDVDAYLERHARDPEAPRPRRKRAA
jgi:predicted site-specific integrase-resolvase